MHSKLKIAIQSSLMGRLCFVQELLSHFILNVSEGNQRIWHKPQEGKLTRPVLFSSSLTCQQLGIQFSPSPLLLHLSALTAAQEPSSWRNERERQEEREEREKEVKEEVKWTDYKRDKQKKTKFQWWRERDDCFYYFDERKTSLGGDILLILSSYKLICYKVVTLVQLKVNSNAFKLIVKT